MKKRWLFLSVALMLVVALLLPACAAEPTPPAEKPAEKPPPVKYTLKLNSVVAENPGEPCHEGIKAWIETVEERSGGQIEIESYPLNTLVPTGESLEALGAGLIDLQYINFVHYESKVQESMVLGLPFFAKDYDDFYAKVYPDVYEILDEAFQKLNVKIVGTWPSGGFSLMTVTKPVHTMEDLEGLIIRVFGVISAGLVDGLGGASAYVAWPELEVALERKTVDGYLTDWNLAAATPGLLEVTRYITFPAVFRSGLVVFMNLDLYNEMPPDLQKLLTDTSKEIALGKAKDALETAEAKTVDVVRDAGWEIYYLPEEELARWKEVARGTWDIFRESVPGPVGEKLLEIAER